MTAFGGAIKLTGESEYRQALQKCTQNLQTMSSALKAQTIDFNNNDKSMKDTATKQKELNDSIRKQQEELNKAKTAYAQYSVAVQAQTTRHNELNKEYKNAVLELDRIKKASGESSDEYKKQAEVVDKLGQELADSTESLNESKTAMAALKSEINSSNKVINDAQKELNDLGHEVEETGDDAKDAADGFTVFKGILADLGSKAIQTAISGLKKLGTTLIDIGKDAISSYASYEQLVGGVETLFKDSSKEVLKYAQQAYKTAGLSANDYMETITSFSASLLQSLGQDTKKAAEYGNLAIIDMSDNANKMGTSMSMIQNAYQGFAKQNYTMLDNLKLGYGGTKTEMERLIKDANKVKEANGEMANLTISKFGDVVEAIHIIQTEMGITGTTSKEASSTIEGSVNSMKASWNNLLTAIADDNQDLGKSVDDFIDSTITASKNLVPKIKTVVNGIKKLINSLVTDVFPKLKKEIPELAPLINVFEWFIKNKNLVVNAIKLMITAFAVNKVMTFTKTLSDTTKKVLELAAGTTTETTAQVANTAAHTAGAVATGVLTKAVNLLNAAWKANPIGLVVAGVTAAIGVFSIFASKNDELTEAEKAQAEAIKQQTEKVKENKDAWDSLTESQQNQMNAGMSELTYYSSLYDELMDLVDANGNVKEGYEERASFITSKLAEALGIEIDKTKSLKDQIKGISSSIDDVMKKKKAQIILDSQESLYAEALNKEQEALTTLNTVQGELNTKKEKGKELEKELDDYLESTVAKLREEGIVSEENIEVIKNRNKALDSEARAIQKKIDKNNEETANLQSTYDTQLNLLQQYSYNKAVYEKNQQLAHEGNVDAMITTNWNYVNSFKDANDAEKAILQDQIEATETHIQILKDMKEQGQTDMYDSQIKADEKQLEELRKTLKQYDDTTAKGVGAAKLSWSDGLDDMLSEITGKNIKFEEGADGNVQAYIDGVKAGEPKSKKEMTTLVSNTLAEVTNKKSDASVAGQNLLDGVNTGLSSQKKQSSCFSTISIFGNNLLASLKRSLQEKSPSKATKEMGQYLLEGLNVGIDSEENKTLKNVSNVGKEVISALQDELNQNVSIGEIGIPSVKNGTVDSYYTPLINSFKEALKDMKIELDDYEVGKFVDKTVSNAVFN